MTCGSFLKHSNFLEQTFATLGSFLLVRLKYLRCTLHIVIFVNCSCFLWSVSVKKTKNRLKLIFLKEKTYGMSNIKIPAPRATCLYIPGVVPEPQGEDAQTDETSRPEWRPVCWERQWSQKAGTNQEEHGVGQRPGGVLGQQTGDECWTQTAGRNRRDQSRGVPLLQHRQTEGQGQGLRSWDPRHCG